MLEKEFQYYLDHQNELVEDYNGLYLVIKDEEIKSSFHTIEEALKFASDNLKAGTYLIQKCSPGDKDYTAIYHSRVIFA